MYATPPPKGKPFTDEFGDRYDEWGCKVGFKDPVALMRAQTAARKDERARLDARGARNIEFDIDDSGNVLSIKQDEATRKEFATNFIQQYADQIEAIHRGCIVQGHDKDGKVILGDDAPTLTESRQEIRWAQFKRWYSHWFPNWLTIGTTILLVVYALGKIFLN